MQFLEQIPCYIVCEERSAGTCWLLGEGSGAWEDLRADGGKVAAVLPNKSVEEILGLDVRAFTVPRGPKGRSDQYPRPIRIPLEHGLIMRARRG